MAKTGRKSKYDEFMDNNGQTLLKGWTREGLTDDQIAKKIGIALSTFYRWKNEFSEFSESLKKGKEVVDYEVENALLYNALHGDVIAQIFWLKNRRPDKWRDKPEYTSDDDDLVKEFLNAIKGNSHDKPHK